MFKSVLSLTLAAALGTASFGQTTLTAIPGEAAAAKYASISQEILRAIEKGNEYLKSKQNPEGYWAQPSYPALTALAVTAYMRDPANQGKPVPEYIRKGYDFILKSQKEDGSIFNRGMSSYNTAVCMMALLAADNGEPPTCAQVNTLKISAEELATMLTAEGVAVEPHPWLPDCLFLNGTGSLEHLEAFQKGYFYIQDAAAHLAVLAAAPQPGWRVLDACAAPGGKSFAAAIAMENRGSVTSCDIHPHKLRLIEAGYQRLGLDIIHANLLDGKERKAELLNSFDLVIADVPCSGLGIIRKKPDIRYKDPEPLENLPRVQAAILDNVADYVRPGGVLLYATCTLLERENEGVVRAFLDKQRDFTLEGFQVSGPFLDTDTGMLTCWPHRHGTDGFFFAKLRRI